MPVKTALRNGKHRVIEAATGRIAKNKGNKAADGGGHKTRPDALRQARAINAGSKK